MTTLQLLDIHIRKQNILMSSTDNTLDIDIKMTISGSVLNFTLTNIHNRQSS